MAQKATNRSKIYHYKLDRILGEGGTGTVYRGIDQNTGEPVAVKVFHANFFSDNSHIRDLAKSVARFKKFDHPNVTRVIDFLHKGEEPALVMEYVDGPDMKRYIQERPWNMDERLVIIYQICNGLQYIHDQGFVHHDLKPENILFTRKGQVKLCDYALRRSKWFAFLESENKLMGSVTPMYIAPEIIEKKGASPQSDMYSLGVVLYLLFTGQFPFKADNLQALYFCHLKEKPEHPTARKPPLPPGPRRRHHEIVEKEAKRTVRVLRSATHRPRQRRPKPDLTAAPSATSFNDPKHPCSHSSESWNPIICMCDN
jgi:eukaryotic-like serine/threonine-protein kinase